MSTPSLQAGNLLTLAEQSFETAVSTWVGSSNFQAQPVRDTQQAYDGTYSLYWQTGGTTTYTAVYVNRYLAATPGQTIRVTGRAFNWGSPAGWMTVSWFNGTTLVSQSATPSTTVSSSTWVLLQGTVTVPSGVTQMQVGFATGTLAATYQQFWLDNVFIGVQSQPVAMTTSSLPAGTVGQPYSAPLSASGGTTPYTFSATGLPPGISVTSGGDPLPVGGAAQYAGQLLGNWNGAALYNWPEIIGGAAQYGGGTSSVDGDGNLVLGTNGQEGNSAEREYPAPGVVGGVIEARLNFPADSTGKVAAWPAFWICGNNWPTDGECDIAEAWAGLIAAHFHWGPVAYPNQGATLQSWDSGDSTMQPGWNVASVVWTPSMCKIFYNGIEFYTFNSPPINAAGLAGPMRIIINITSSSQNSGAMIPAQLKVEYIRRWAVAP